MIIVRHFNYFIIEINNLIIPKKFFLWQIIIVWILSKLSFFCILKLRHLIFTDVKRILQHDPWSLDTDGCWSVFISLLKLVVKIWSYRLLIHDEWRCVHIIIICVVEITYLSSSHFETTPVLGLVRVLCATFLIFFRRSIQNLLIVYIHF